MSGLKLLMKKISSPIFTEVGLKNNKYGFYDSDCQKLARWS